jgi:hypothetical protein
MDCPDCGARQLTCAFCGEPTSAQRPAARSAAGPFAGLLVHAGGCESDLLVAWVASSDGVTGRLLVD